MRDAPELRFEMLMDLAVVDYSQFRMDEWQTHSATRTGFSRGRLEVEELVPPAPVAGARFAVVYHLLSVTQQSAAARAREVRERGGAGGGFGG